LKKERNKKINEVIDNAIEYFSDQEEITPQQIREAVEQIQKEIVRKAILDEGRRPDGRALDELREISCEVGTLPRTHASALFTRGETQALTVATLGTAEDEQILDDIEGKSTKRFMVHYNFPPFSVGEIGGLRGPGRREIGHGALAERALLPVIPSQEEFPYTIRVVSDILESNGSTSMASTCGGSLALMDAGVPIKAPVAGISIGLVHECDRFTLLTDIIGMEDQCGDMDFKVAGTRKGITAIQVDIKILGLSREIVAAALTQAKHARNKILDIMEQAISEPNKEISPYAPKVHIITIPPDKIKDVIGPGGREIKRIVDTTGTKINIGDDGVTTISGPDKKSIEQAVEMISYLTTEIEVGQIYMGKVLRTTSFGAFIEVMPGREGLVHISQLSDSRITRVEDVVKEGDEIPVKLINIDDQGRLNFSYKMALREQGKIRYPNQNILQQQQYTRYSPKYNTKYKTV
jgi:polyribonucleotide nucleotidyltransferase